MNNAGISMGMEQLDRLKLDMQMGAEPRKENDKSKTKTPAGGKRA